jgi:hypothetical protein
LRIVKYRDYSYFQRALLVETHTAYVILLFLEENTGTLRRSTPPPPNEEEGIQVRTAVLNTPSHPNVAGWICIMKVNTGNGGNRI